MSGFIKFILFIAVVAAGAYFTFKVPLGDKTLSQHLQGISQTPEAVALGTELEKKAATTKDEVLSSVPEIKSKKISGDKSEKKSPRVATKPDGASSGKKQLSGESKEDKDALVQLLREKSQ